MNPVCACMHLCPGVLCVGWRVGLIMREIINACNTYYRLWLIPTSIGHISRLTYLMNFMLVTLEDKLLNSEINGVSSLDDILLIVYMN